MQKLDQIDSWYENEDPWGYQKNQDDKLRKEKILSHLSQNIFYYRALDLGAGEGWITKDLPAEKIYGIEVSDNAANRFPPKVKRIIVPDGKYDLIIATGVLYEHYSYKKFLDIIKKHASKTVVTCNIKTWEINTLPQEKQIYYEEFPYRDKKQVLRVYDFAS